MPELPEVENIAVCLASAITGLVVENIHVSRPKLRRPISVPPVGCRVLSVRRRAKYLIIELDNGQFIIIHLGMSGRLTVSHLPYVPAKHDHVVMYLSGGKVFAFNDARRFGIFEVQDSDNIPGLGHEPDNLDIEVFADCIIRSRGDIKSVLTSGKIIVGIGNIYSSEILFASKIDPTRRASSLKYDEAKRILNSTKEILDKATKMGGSSIKDYINAYGDIGGYQEAFLVYDRKDKDCHACGSKIVKFKQGGRATYACVVCQGMKSH